MERPAMEGRVYRDIIAQEIMYKGHEGVEKNAYYAHPLGGKPVGGIVFIHHIPGWNEICIETARRLAHHGFACISHNMYSSYGEGDPDDIGARARAEGGVSDEQMLGDVAGAMAFLRAQKESNGKVGIMGYCSGGRQSYLAGCRLPNVDAVVDCWGGRVMVKDPSALTPKQPAAPIDFTKDLKCPIIGIFGNDDKEPDPAQVNKTEETLKSLGKTYEFYRYDGAGHAFFDWSRPSYRAEQAMDAWKKIFAFLNKNIS
jgi:carboxymethylenebutenolidase